MILFNILILCLLLEEQYIKSVNMASFLTWLETVPTFSQTNKQLNVHTPNQKIATKFPLATFQSADADQDRMLRYINFYIFTLNFVFSASKRIWHPLLL